MIDYARGGDLLEAYGTARASFDGDAWVALFTEDAEYHEDPFGAPHVGHNALRSFLLEAANRQRDVDFTVERHWVSGSTVLAALHAALEHDWPWKRTLLVLAASVLPAGPFVVEAKLLRNETVQRGAEA